MADMKKTGADDMEYLIGAVTEKAIEDVKKVALQAVADLKLVAEANTKLPERLHDLVYAAAEFHVGDLELRDASQHGEFGALSIRVRDYDYQMFDRHYAKRSELSGKYRVIFALLPVIEKR
jgi:hypothetical protein